MARDPRHALEDLKPGQILGWKTGEDGPAGMNPAEYVAELEAVDAIADISGAAWNDLRVPLSTANLPAVSDPTYAEFRTGVYAQRFSATQDNVVAFEVQLPHSYTEGTDLKPHLHWASATATASGTVTWKLTYTIANRGGVFPVPVDLSGTYTFDGTELAFEHQITSLGTIPGAELGVSAVLIGTLTRMASLDTYADPVFGLSFDIHHQQDSLGSDAEFTK